MAVFGYVSHIPVTRFWCLWARIKLPSVKYSLLQYSKIEILSQNIKKMQGKNFLSKKKSRSAEKNERGESLVSPGMVCYAEKQEKPFCFSSLDQIVQFGAIIFCRTFVELFWSVRVDRKKSHYNSRVSLHEAPTKKRHHCIRSWKFFPTPKKVSSLFSRNIQYRERLKRLNIQYPLSFFSELRLFEKKFPPKGPPSIFWCFATEWMLKNPKGSPLWARQGPLGANSIKYFEVLLLFLSLRYGADLGRSRLVCFLTKCFIDIR